MHNDKRIRVSHGYVSWSLARRILQMVVVRQRCNLRQLFVLQFVRFLERENERKRSGGQCNAKNYQQEPGRKPELKRVFQFRFHLKTIHPTPLTFLTELPPSFLRSAWIRNSTALLSTSSFQP